MENSSSSTKQLAPGDRVRHRQGWEGTLKWAVLVGRTITEETIYKWIVARDDGREQGCDASELVLCNTRQGESAILLHKTNPVPPVLCNKQIGNPTQLLHKIIAEVDLLPLLQLEQLQRHIAARIANLTANDIPLKEGRELIDRVVSGSNVYQLEKIKCGKSNCKSCPHGPYWYAYFRSNGKLRSKYVGKELKATV